MTEKIQIPEKVQLILSTLESSGFESYVVGGSIRDILRGKSPKDWDVTTQATPIDVKNLFTRTVDTGIKHGTVTVLMGKDRIEVTTYRIDGEYIDSRRPESVDFTNEIYEDLSRRDFTMNAIAYNPNRGFVDPFEGRTDIKQKLIRSVGDAKLRFKEDALRMLRAVRFAGVFGFAVDESIHHAITELRENMLNISAERIREEIGKLLLGEYAEALCYLDSTGLTPFMLMEPNKAINALAPPHIITQIKKTPTDEPMRLAILLNQLGEAAPDILRRLRYDNKTTKTVSIYIRHLQETILPNRVQLKKLLQHMSPEVLENLLTLKEIAYNENLDPVRDILHDIISSGECYSMGQLKINGNDLIALGINQGAEIGKTLSTLLETVISNPSLNNKQKLLELIKQSKKP